jgi:small subunit ribosomal protein S6
VSRNYELTIIVKPDVDATNFAGVLDKVKGYITAEGGSILKQNEWGMRRLMYPIRKFREGQYVFMLVALEAPVVARIESRLRLNEDVIRYLLIRADDVAPVAEAAAPQEAEAQAPAPEAPAAPPPNPEPASA